MPDSEIEALSKVAAALDGLDDAAVVRIMSWVASKFKVQPPAPKVPAKPDGAEDASADYRTFPDFYDAANPKTENEKVLVGAYWLQSSESREEWDSQSVNTMLKNLGHPISNITRTLDRLQSHKPRLAMQTQKTGKARQARKTYKLTVEGVKIAKKMLSGEPVDLGEGS